MGSRAAPPPISLNSAKACRAVPHSAKSVNKSILFEKVPQFSIIFKLKLIYFFFIVFLFLVCHFPRILLNVHEIFMLADMTACGEAFSPPGWYLCFVSFNHLLLIVNASCNFLIYASVGVKFKTTISKLCHCTFCCKSSPTSAASTTELRNGHHETELTTTAMPLIEVHSGLPAKVL